MSKTKKEFKYNMNRKNYGIYYIKNVRYIHWEKKQFFKKMEHP